MGLTKYALFFFMFISILEVVSADEIRVLYFFNTEQTLPEGMKTAIDNVKNKWVEKIEWIEYDYSNETHKHWFKEYKIVSLPVAVIECFDHAIKIRRSDRFADELNKNIHDCYVFYRPTDSGLRKFPSNELILWTVFVVCLNLFLIICLRRRLAKRKKIK